MRTTLSLDADVAAMLEAEAHRLRRPYKQVVNDALRRGLSPGGATRDVTPFTPQVYHLELAAGVDPARMNQLVDELEAEEHVSRLVIAP